MSRKFRNVICALIGHSRLTTSFFGYVHCGRCEQQLGDTLAGCYPVMCDLNHGCAECQAGYLKATWKDKLLVKKPAWTGWTAEDWTAKNKRERDAAFEAIRKSAAERASRA